MNFDFEGKLTINKTINNDADQNVKPDKIVKSDKKGLDLSPQGIINGIIFSELISAPRYRKGYRYVRRRKAD